MKLDGPLKLLRYHWNAYSFSYGSSQNVCGCCVHPQNFDGQTPTLRRSRLVGISARSASTVCAGEKSWRYDLTEVDLS